MNGKVLSKQIMNNREAIKLLKSDINTMIKKRNSLSDPTSIKKMNIDIINLRRKENNLIDKTNDMKTMLYRIDLDTFIKDKQGVVIE